MTTAEFHRMKTTSTTSDLAWHSASELARLVATGEVSASEVVTAHIERIEAVNGRLNAVVWPMFDEARRDAAAADLARRRGEPLGALHGVPVTIKECFFVAGTPSTLGVARHQHELIAEDGPLVARLRRAGAIVLGKTNVPQLMLLHETDNPVYGRTNNPWNLERSPGGSSGGEAAIIAAGGSPLGLASDLGGSIRQPAHVCGVHGLLPTVGRLPNGGKRPNLLGLESIGLQSGPLARRVDDLHLAMRVLTSAELDRYDPRVAPVPLGNPASVDLAGLRVGYWTDDGYFAASPAIRRVTREAADVMRNLGAHVEPFEPPDVADVMDTYFGLISADGGAGFRQIMQDCPSDWRVRRLLRIGGCPRLPRIAIVEGLKMFGQRRLPQLIGASGARSARSYWALTAKRAAYRERFLAMLRERQLDILLMPPHALPAPRHGSTMHLPASASYCFLINMLHLPAGVVAASRVQPDECTDRPESGDWVERAAREVEIGSAGLPVGVQVVGKPWREDSVLAVMGALERHFSSHPDYPAKPPV